MTDTAKTDRNGVVAPPQPEGVAADAPVPAPVMINQDPAGCVVITPPSGWDSSSLRGLRAVVDEDRDVNGRSLLTPATQMMIVHRFGEWLFDDARNLRVRKLGTQLYRMGYAYVRNVLGFEVARTVKIGRRVKFVHQHGVVIHPQAEIGDGSKVHHGVTLGMRGDPDENGVYGPPPLIGAGVQLGVGASVIGAIRVGDGAHVGPNAVVTRDIPAGASVIATPSRIMRLH